MNTKIIILGFLSIAVVLTLIFGSTIVKSEDGNSAYRVGGMTENVRSNHYFLETGWRTVEDWEVERCSRKLSSDLTKEVDNNYAFDENELAYGTSVTLQAIFTENYGDYYYELAWYVRPTSKNITYSLDVVDENGNRKSIVESKKVNQYEGGGSYDAFIDTKIYSYAELIFDGEKMKVSFVENKQ